MTELSEASEANVLEAADCDLLRRLFGSGSKGWNISTDGSKYYTTADYAPGEKIEKALRAQGIDAQSIFGSEQFITVSKGEMAKVRALSSAARQEAMSELAARDALQR